MAETRTERAESRTELAKTRTEQAETRTELAEARTERAEAALRQGKGELTSVNPLPSLSGRQREILQLIAEGQNTKRIADLLNVSPKAVEYHRMKLMALLGIHEVAGLVRYAIQVGLLPLGTPVTHHLCDR